jgi:hypothetical protein
MLYLANLSTLWSKVFLEKLRGPHIVKNLPAVYGTRRFVTAFKSTRHLSLPKYPHITKPTHTNTHTLQNKLKQPQYEIHTKLNSHKIYSSTFSKRSHQYTWYFCPPESTFVPKKALGFSLWLKSFGDWGWFLSRVKRPGKNEWISNFAFPCAFITCTAIDAVQC